MASSRASSPASRGGSPEPLTPRSKIRALLATVESSDEEGSSRKPTGSIKSKSPSFAIQFPNSLRRSPQPTLDNESDESDIAVRPRGKLASRMQGVEKVHEKEPQRSPPAPESARERVRQMLENKDAGHVDDTASNGEEEEEEEEEEDDDLPAVPRRLKRRVPAHESTDIAGQAPRSPSPGLFVSSPMRPSPVKDANTGEDGDNELPALKSDRFKALVERKRQERLAREAAEAARDEERRAQQEKLASELDELVSDDDDDGITDDEGGRRLTQEGRPARKASKKAIEEMNRETQRMARSMQLAHEAKTRKKISKASLFERFNFKPAGAPETEPQPNSSSRPATPQSDVEMEDADTPPSSPPLNKEDENKNTRAQEAGVLQENDTLDPTTRPTSATKTVLPTTSVEISQPEKSRRRVRVRLPVVSTNMANFDSDDELEIMTTTKNKIDAIFENLPSKKSSESQSMQVLRALAQVKSPGKETGRKKDQSKMTPGELRAYLHLKARQQAKLERERRLEILKGQGIIIQTAEERERQEQEVEDLVAKAREEAQKIMKEEHESAKRENKKNGVVDPLAWDDSDDEEYKDSADEADAKASAVELSGSEDEELDDATEGDEETGQALFDEVAECASEVDDTIAQDQNEDEDEQPIMKHRRARNKTNVLSDDEAEIDATPRPVKTTTQMSPAATSNMSSEVPNSVLRSAKKTFIPGLPVKGAAGLGLTQIFAGTMDSQMSGSPSGPTQSMMPDFDHFPDSNFSSATMDEPKEEVIADTQREEAGEGTQVVQLNMSQSQMHGLDTLIADGMQTQMSDVMELSQDGGLQQYTPLRERFVEPPFSTVDTMIADKQDSGVSHDSPLVRRRRLRCKMDMSAANGDVMQASKDRVSNTEVDAFKALGDAARKEKKRLQLAEEFDRKKSKAKEMVEVQAEESEDEYAGLGGVDGEDSDNESNASVEEMIDDAAGNDNDEGKLAAFYADRERANDEQQVEKLFKDITTGMLRRKRGADFDLSDSDDDGEARRRMKRRQFAKMQKALFADERVKKIAENPGNQAFLRTIEDHGSEDETDFLGLLDSPSQAEPQSQDESEETQQAQETTTTIPNSQPLAIPALLSTSENRVPANRRRTRGGKKPSNIGEVRATLSNLLEEPQGSVIPATEAGSDSEEEEDTEDEPSMSRTDKENQAPSHPRRTASASIVDRISLKRTTSAATSAGSRSAFTTQASSSFKVPALLRRATTNSSLMSGASASSSSSSSSSMASGSASGFGEAAKIKKSAGKKSGIGGFARENEQRAKVQESERRRQERKVKGAEKRIGMVGGLLGRGSFQ